MIKYRLHYSAGLFTDYPTREAAELFAIDLAALGVSSSIDEFDCTPPPAPVPSEVTPLQMRRALNAAGLRSTVEAAVAAASQDARDAWEFATVVLRSDPLITSMATELGMSTAQVDGLFVAAASYG